MLSAQDIIDHFKLEPLPVEGGIFYQTYQSPEVIASSALPERYQLQKPMGTAIVYLYLPEFDSFSAMHKLPTDEIYHFYLGDPVELLQLYPSGETQRVILGQDILNGQQVQYVAPKDVWQGSYLLPGGKFALIGTTMAPGFTEDDYIGGDRSELEEKYPAEAELIRRLTRPDAPLRMI
ncbi:MAG: cupin domain-containing protein [Chloroflexi bacterium]|nr:cupin domain-containing protein [Chloroflexota bacterium]